MNLIFIAKLLIIRLKCVTLQLKLNVFMQIDTDTGLVLEGGGMRGVFTSGVLDAFMKHEVWFRYVVAVSAGACNGMSYISRQPRRARISNIDYLARYNYIGIKLWSRKAASLTGSCSTTASPTSCCLLTMTSTSAMPTVSKW